VITLIGQYDSGFVRRAAIALHHHGIPFARKVLSVYADFDAVRAVNPLGKAPALVLEDGRVLPDSRAIVEWLERAAPPERRLISSDPDAAFEVLQVEAVGLGLAEKVHERGVEVARKAPAARDPAWIARLEAQIASALGWLEARAPEGFWAGGRLSRADLAVALAATWAHEKLPQLYDGRFARVEAHRRFCEALPVFRAAPYSKDEAAATGWRPEPAALDQEE
jgi:glutathione S-transferase